MANRTRQASTLAVIPTVGIQQLILLIRGHRVILDTDLARLYGVTTKRLNEQVKRNARRFPEDFMFKLSRREKEEVVANCDHLQALKFSATTPVRIHRTWGNHGRQRSKR